MHGCLHNGFSEENFPLMNDESESTKPFESVFDKSKTEGLMASELHPLIMQVFRYGFNPVNFMLLMYRLLKK